MHPRKYFTPAEGLQIPDPATRKIVPPEGQWVYASSYWQRRVLEGSGQLEDQAPAGVTPPADAAPVTIDRS